MPRPHVEDKDRKSPAGRPIEWTEERIDKLIDDYEKWLEEEENHITVKRFLIKAGVTSDQLRHLKQISPRFALTYKRAKELQELNLKTNCLNGKYNNTMGIFLLKCNHGYNDKEVPTHVKQQAKSGTDHNVIVNIPGLQEPKE